MSNENSLSASALFGSLSGRVALVTGGGTGLGYMMSKSLVENGATVYIASRKEKQLAPVAAALTKMGPGKCEYIVGNIGSKAGCDELVAEVKKRTQVLNIVSTSPRLCPRLVLGAREVQNEY